MWLQCFLLDVLVFVVLTGFFTCIVFFLAPLGQNESEVVMPLTFCYVSYFF